MGGNNQKSWGLDVGRVDCSLVLPVSALLRAVTWDPGSSHLGTSLPSSHGFITIIAWPPSSSRKKGKWRTTRDAFQGPEPRVGSTPLPVFHWP